MVARNWQDVLPFSDWPSHRLGAPYVSYPKLLPYELISKSVYRYLSVLADQPNRTYTPHRRYTRSGSTLLNQRPPLMLSCRRLIWPFPTSSLRFEATCDSSRPSSSSVSSSTSSLRSTVPDRSHGPRRTTLGCLSASSRSLLHCISLGSAAA